MVIKEGLINMEEKKKLIILTGPTAVGKTKLSIETARMLNAEIISADSMQVYKYMDIGTAKITKEEMEDITHYMVDELEPEEEFNVVVFKRLALKYMDEIYKKGKIPLIVGGTGFYIQALLYDIDFTENDDDGGAIRKELEELVRVKGEEYLHSELAKVDKESADDIHPNNVKKVIRALEYYRLTGQKMSEHNKEQRQKESPYNFLYLVLNDDRQLLYDRIDKRIDIMLKDGLIDEVKFLKEKGYTKDLVSMQGLGYKEILDYLDGSSTLDEAIYILKRDTRHFAKRQLTWFRREKVTTWIDKSKFENDEAILEYIKDLAIEKGIL